MKKIFTTTILLYKALVSPVLEYLFGKSCRHQPTCSLYAREAIAVHGLVKGLRLSLNRLVRCHPLGSSGYDPVPR